MTNQPKPTASALWREWATNGLTPREIHVLIDDLAALERQLAEKDAQLAEWTNAAKMVADERCSGDEKHCGCVVVLRHENAAMRETLIAVLDEAVLQDPFQDDKGQAVLERGRKAAGETK